MTKPMITSRDFEDNQTSFTLETDDRAFIRPTVVYVKGSPATHADAVTVIVWFHGFYVPDRKTLFNDLAGMEVKLLENLKSCPVKELIFIAPWMGNVKPAIPKRDPQGEKIPLLDKDKKVIPDKFEMWNPGSAEYSEVEAALGKAADSYLAKVLAGLADFLNDFKQTLKTSGGKAASGFTIKNLIVASHSGGGAGMRAFVEGLGTSNTAALKGCWCFDCLYGRAAPKFWFNRDASAAPFYAYYQDTETRAKELLKLMGHERDKEFQGGTLNVIDYSAKSHYLTASEGFAERLKNLKLP